MESRDPLQIDWANQTTLHPIGVVAVVILGLSMLVVPRRWATAPLLIMACFVAQAQRMVIAGFDFDLMRMLVLAGWLRLLLRSEYQGLRWVPIDTVFVAYLISGSTIMLLQHGTTAVLVNRMGWTFDAAGTYFLIRCLVRTWQDIAAPFIVLAVLSIPVAIGFFIENRTGRNQFAIFGGVPEFTAIRGGRLRCQGAFSHPILAGCFWAAVLPGFIVMLVTRSSVRILVGIAVVCAIAIIILSASSTPIMAMCVGLLGLALYPLRWWLSTIRWMVFTVLVMLHLAMNAPVWHLISRIGLVGGSTGWHRFQVIDQTLAHFGEWWLLGTKSTLGWGFWDITNYYVLTAVGGGLLTLALLLALLYLAFRSTGRMIRAMEGHRYRQLLAWAVGLAMVVHCANFLATSYFGQIVVLWYLHLAMAACLGVPAVATTHLSDSETAHT